MKMCHKVWHMWHITQSVAQSVAQSVTIRQMTDDCKKIYKHQISKIKQPMRCPTLGHLGHLRVIGAPFGAPFFRNTNECKIIIIVYLMEND